MFFSRFMTEQYYPARYETKQVRRSSEQKFGFALTNVSDGRRVQLPGQG